MHPMMEQGSQMAENPGFGHLAAGGLVATGAYVATRGILGKVLRNPLVLLAAGFAAGYLVHKYRREIVLAVSKATGAGKDFWLEQKESLADLVAEGQEAEEQAAKAAVASGGEARPARQPG